MHKPLSVTVALKRMKYLGVNLTKQVQDLHSTNCKTLEEEIKYDLKCVDRHTVFMDWQTRFRENANSLQIDLYV